MNNSGTLAEMRVCDYLKRKGYKLLEANYSCRFGEIDLIMKKRKYLCFIEVKCRDVNSIASPAEFVDTSKQKKIILCAEYYLNAHPTDLQPRFDVAEVYSEGGAFKSINYLENAFGLG